MTARQAEAASRLPEQEIAAVMAARNAAYDAQEALIERARVGEIDMDQLGELSQQIEWPRWSRHTLGPCMPGCAYDHGAGDAFEETVDHERLVALIPTAQPGKSARVWWGFVDNLPEGIRSATEIGVEGADDGLSPEGARLLAAALLEAVAAVAAWQVAR